MKGRSDGCPTRGLENRNGRYYCTLHGYGIRVLDDGRSWPKCGGVAR